MQNGKSGGFTLIELMIVVAVIGILGAIAYPTYQDSVRKSRRADARSTLLQAAQWMERYYTVSNRYDQDRSPTPVSVTSTTPGANSFPNSGLTNSPNGAATPAYSITLSNVSQTGYQLNAAPTGPQSGDKCGTLTLTNTGVRGVTGGSLTVAECWR